MRRFYNGTSNISWKRFAARAPSESGIGTETLENVSSERRLPETQENLSPERPWFQRDSKSIGAQEEVPR